MSLAVGKWAPVVSKTNEDSAYVALRKLLDARLLSPETRERANRALREINKDAFKETIRQNLIEDNTSAAAD